RKGLAYRSLSAPARSHDDRRRHAGLARAHRHRRRAGAGIGRNGHRFGRQLRACRGPRPDRQLARCRGDRTPLTRHRGRHLYLHQSQRNDREALMVSNDVLAAAVSESIITDAQAAALRDLASRRERERIADLGTEEHFRFMRGFNDFFLALGVAFLCSSMLYFSTTPLMLLLSAVLVWALAELLVGRMRLVLPGILLACFFVILVFGAVPVDEWLTTS